MGFFDDVDTTSIQAEDTEPSFKKKAADDEVNEDAELMEELLGNFNPLSGDSEEDDDDDDDDFVDEVTDPEEEVKPAPVHQSEHKSAVTKKPLPSKEEPSPVSKNREMKTKPPIAKQAVTPMSKSVAGGKKNVVLSGTTIGGDISAEGDIEVGGRVDGHVTATGSIHVLPNALIRGDASGGNIVVEGKVTGRVAGDNVSLIGPGMIKGGISSSGNISIGEGTSVIGDVAAEADVVIQGGVKGDIEVKNMVTVKSTAIIQGNIVSALVSIEPGAALDGTCTQAYAKISPAEYFANMDDDAE